jgi:hypothetical protein
MFAAGQDWSHLTLVRDNITDSETVELVSRTLMEGQAKSLAMEI